jgi:hypothetical protein
LEKAAVTVFAATGQGLLGLRQAAGRPETLPENPGVSDGDFEELMAARGALANCSRGANADTGPATSISGAGEFAALDLFQTVGPVTRQAIQFGASDGNSAQTAAASDQSPLTLSAVSAVLLADQNSTFQSQPSVVSVVHRSAAAGIANRAELIGQSANPTSIGASENCAASAFAEPSQPARLAPNKAVARASATNLRPTQSQPNPASIAMVVAQAEGNRASVTTRVAGLDQHATTELELRIREELGSGPLAPGEVRINGRRVSPRVED